MSMSHEMLVTYALIGLHAVWVLLPLVPAILIYRLFPNTAVAVSGPLSNLTLKASGAFAAYFIILLVTLPLVQRHEDVFGRFERPVWTIEGHIKLFDKDGKEVISDALLGKTVVQTNPRPHKVEGYFLQMDIPDTGRFPWLILEIPGFGKAVVNLSELRSRPDEVIINKLEKVIELRNPIAIKEFPTAHGVLESRPQLDREKP
jgi:hypothetical protein